MSLKDNLIIGTWQEPDNLNGYLTWTASGVWFGMLALDSLLRPNGRGGYEPVLCERVPSVENGDVSRDGTRIVYRIKPGVRWADGMPLSSADLKFTWKVLSNPLNTVVGTESFEHVTHVETPDDQTAVLYLDQPYAAYPMLYMSVFPRHLFGRTTDIRHASFNLTPQGTGPYYVAEWRRGEAIHYRRNNFYRGPGPHFEQLQVRVFRSQDDLVAALIAGEVDLAIALSIHHLERLADNPRVRVFMQSSAHIDRVMYNLRDPLLGDRRIRHALDYAIDREELIREAAGGLVEPAVSELDGSAWFSPIATRSYDPAKSNMLLDDAGWHRGSGGTRYKEAVPLSVTLIAVAGDKLRERMMATLRAMLSRVGVQVAIRVYPTSEYFRVEGPLVQGAFQLAMVSQGMFGDPEPEYTVHFHSALIPSAKNSYVGGNRAAYRNEQVDHWLEEAVATLDPARRKAIYGKIEQQIHDDCPASFLYKRPIIDACRADLIGLQYLPYPSVWCLTWSANDWRLAA